MKLQEQVKVDNVITIITRRIVLLSSFLAFILAHQVSNHIVVVIKELLDCMTMM